jgi:hypothetical protein
MRAKLTKAGAAVSGTQTGGETYNEMFKSSLQAGGVGPDWAGYSSLANLDPKTLEKFAGGDFELTGGSKGMQENARQLRDRMLAEQKIGGGEDKKTKGEEKKAKPLAEQTKNDTAIIKTETEKQATQFTKLNKTIGDGWIGLEKRGLVHYTAMSELARIAAQAEIDYMRDCVNFGGEHPIIQNKIIMSATGPDWAPPPFQALASTKLAAANFSSVAFSGDIGKKSEGDEKGEEKTKNEVVVNVAVNVDKNGLATASAKSTTTAIQRSGVGT